MNERYNSMRTVASPHFFQLIADIFSVFLSYSIQYYLRFQSGLFGSPIDFTFFEFFAAGLVLLFYWISVFWFSGLYKNWYVRSAFDEFFTVFRVTFIGSLVIFFIWLLDSESKEPRLLFLVFFVVFGFTVNVGRYFVRVIQRKLREKGVIAIPSLIIGNFERAKRLYRDVNKYKKWGYEILGIILVNNENINNDEREAAEENGLPILGTDANTVQLLDEYKPSEVIISLDYPKRSYLLDLANECSKRKISVKIIPDLYEYFTGKVRTLHLYDIPLIEINAQLLKPWQETLKRAFDIVFSAIVILICLPLWIFIPIIIKLETPGPVFYKQTRVGKNGKKFTMIKFRSMIKDAEKISGPKWAQVNDPRVTKFGKFLRKSHIDELPQFWNVLIGDMSVVGPRPERPHFVEKFSKLASYYKRRLIVRPGITGWSQIKYRHYVESKEEIENRLKDDFFYIENMSFKLDFEIIVRTIFLVIKGHGQT